ncbi:MAG: hypothetical protein IKC83_03815 [Clostridia bacterium]|nr:hypothetical protein [Clostridia bacterium]
MCKDILIGMMLGVAVGMMLKGKNSSAEETIDKAKSAIKTKLKDIAEKI